MSNFDTGGPAFPRPMAETSLGGNFDQEGMTLRDYFAAKAMQTLIKTIQSKEHVKLIATTAYAMADLMLEARK